MVFIEKETIYYAIGKIMDKIENKSDMEYIRLTNQYIDSVGDNLYDYNKKYIFRKGKTMQLVKIGFEELYNSFRSLHTNKYPKDMTRPPPTNRYETIETWVNGLKNHELDAFIQLTLFGKIRYDYSDRYGDIVYKRGVRIYKPEPCPYCRARVSTDMTLGTYWTTCRNKDCGLFASSKPYAHKKLSVESWNKIAQKCNDGEIKKCTTYRF